MADDLDPNQAPTAAAEPPPAGPVESDEPLPTMADLDRVASELDEIDARLAALDEQRP